MPERFANLEDFRSFLESVNPQLAEHPPGFDFSAARARARHLVSELKRNLGTEFKLDESIQDSTHGAEISLPLDVLRDTSVVQPAVRISNHAGLVTVTCARKVEPSTLERIIGVTQQCGYTFVPEAVFGDPFDTRERGNGDLFNQLFDYT